MPSMSEAASNHCTDIAPRWPEPDTSTAQKPARVRRHYSYSRKKGKLLVLPSAATAEGKRLREFHAGLIAHVGGSPSFTQLVLIDRCTMLQQHLTAFDRRAAAEGGLGDLAGRQYLAWQNTLTRTLVQLGLQASERKADPFELIAAMTAPRTPDGE